jgi:predicted MFS family arabinose efflux permease
MTFNLIKAGHDLQNYFVVTLAYWGFTLTDGAIRMLVVLYFYQLGYSPLEIAMLFLFYELCGVITNFIGGWMASHMGLNTTMHLGMGLQVFALLMLAVPVSWLSVPYVMMAQAVSGIAKDLNKMSAKASVKLMLPDEAQGKLFKWVAFLTGSKNTIKGLGFFLGGLLLNLFSFQTALFILAFGLLVLLIATFIFLPKDMGKTKAKIKFKHLFSKSKAINTLSAARLFLFGARDVWFVVALPVYLSAVLGWSHTQVGSFFALWVIGYGIVQANAPRLIRRAHHNSGPDGATAKVWAFILFLVLSVMTFVFSQGIQPELIIVTGLIVFAVVFAINSAVHSYLILAYSSDDQVSVDVGFYYMANATGRLIGTVLSGWVYQIWGLEGCLWWSAGFILITTLISTKLPEQKQRLACQ